MGWGSLAGPIISVVAVFRDKDLALMPPGVRDSKKTTRDQRNAMYLPLCQAAYEVGVGHSWPWEIDQYGPYQALQLSYRRAILEIPEAKRPRMLYVDGNNRVEIKKALWDGYQIVEPKADVRYIHVSAASIIAKVFRDEIMSSYAKTFRGYGWEHNSGYGTEDHIAAIKKLGLLIDGSNKELYLHRQKYCRKLMGGRRA